MLAYHIFLLVFSTFVIWKTCDAFQAASLYLGRNMPQGVRGATINAAGSSFPEFLTSFIAAFKYMDDDGAVFGMFNILGSYIYNITIIPFAVIVGCMVFGNIRRLKFNRYMVLRDGLFVIFSLGMLLIMMARGTVTLTDSILLTLIYVVYVLYILNYPKKSDREEARDRIRFRLRRKSWLRAICDIDFYEILFRGRKNNSVFASVVVLALCIVVFYFTCSMLVSSSYALGDILGIPSFLVAMTITAAATSIPDTILSVKDARIGEFEDSITNAVGTNVFNVSFCIGFPFLVYSLVRSDIRFSLSGVGTLSALMIMLMLAILAVLLLFGKRWRLRAASIFAAYVLFLSLSVSEMQKARASGAPARGAASPKEDVS